MLFFFFFLFRLLKNASDASAVHSFRNCTKKKKKPLCDFWAVQEKRAGDISRYRTVFCFIPQCLSGKWVFCVFPHREQTCSVRPAAYDELHTCAASLENKTNVFAQIVTATALHSSLPNTGLVWMFIFFIFLFLFFFFKRGNINTLLCGSLAVVPKHGLAIGII